VREGEGEEERERKNSDGGREERREGERAKK
jgi:hypothetical protein